jgi:hypothetical protein
VLSCILTTLQVIGKTHMDELAYSLMGQNAHYGTPVNTAAPGRVPGGSSSGSAVSKDLLLLLFVGPAAAAAAAVDCMHTYLAAPAQVLP